MPAWGGSKNGLGKSAKKPTRGAENGRGVALVSPGFSLKGQRYFGCTKTSEYASTKCPRLRRFVALLGADGQQSGPCRRDRRALRPCARRRVSRHEPPSGLDPFGVEARRARPHRSR